MTRCRLLLLAPLLACGGQSGWTLDIRTPETLGDPFVADSARSRFAKIQSFHLAAFHDSQLVADGLFAASTSTFTLSRLPRIRGMFIRLDGYDGPNGTGQIVARGQTCSFDTDGSTDSHRVLSLYFAPTDFFAPTLGKPIYRRSSPIVLTLGDGKSVLIAGGSSMGANLAGPAEIYSPESGTFSSAGGSTTIDPPVQAKVASIDTLGALIGGGRDGLNAALPSNKLGYSRQQNVFKPFDDMVGRVYHQIVPLPPATFQILGGCDSTGALLHNSEFIDLQADGTTSVRAGPSLSIARKDFAAVSTAGAVYLIGGWQHDPGSPWILPTSQVEQCSTSSCATLSVADNQRVLPTAGVDQNGNLLVVGGAGSTSIPIQNWVLETTSGSMVSSGLLYSPRYLHAMTDLGGGRFLVSGGVAGGIACNIASNTCGFYDIPANCALQTSTETWDGRTFARTADMVSARAQHATTLLCDGTVLLFGGTDPNNAAAAISEIYSPAAR